MELEPVFLSRLQFGFVISFHIIFPAFTLGLAAWLATIEGAQLATGNALYRRVFGVHRLHAGVYVLRRHAPWARSGVATLLLLCLLHGLPGNDVLVVLDTRQ